MFDISLVYNTETSNGTRIVCDLYDEDHVTVVGYIYRIESVYRLRYLGVLFGPPNKKDKRLIDEDFSRLLKSLWITYKLM